MSCKHTMYSSKTFMDWQVVYIRALFHYKNFVRIIVKYYYRNINVIKYLFNMLLPIKLFSPKQNILFRLKLALAALHLINTCF